MPSQPSDDQHRESLARDAIYRAYEEDHERISVALFVEHHLTEIESEYWVEYFGATNPDPRLILETLVLQTDVEDDEEEDADMLDFTLPGDATNYLICVRFDESGDVAGVSMES